MTKEYNGWHDGEVAYCLNLIESGGNSDVPRDSVYNYLMAQSVTAQNEHLTVLADKFKQAAEWFKFGRPDTAIAYLNQLTVIER